MSYAVDAAALRRSNRLLQKVIQLPVEIISRHFQKNTRSPIWINQLVFEVLPANVHVRHETQDVRIFFEDKRGLRFIVGLAGWDDQVSRKGAGGNHSLFDWRFCEIQPDARPVLAR